MRVWYQIEASEDGKRNIRGKLNEGKFLVRHSNGHLYACVGIAHQETLKDIARSFGGHLLRLEGPPADIKDRITPRKDEYAAPCGVAFYDPRMLTTHISVCGVCAQIRGIAPKRRGPAPKARVVGRLVPGQPLTLDGVLASIEAVHDQMFGEVERLSNLLCELRSFRDKRDEYKAKLVEAKQIRAAAKLVWEEIDKALGDGP